MKTITKIKWATLSCGLIGVGLIPVITAAQKENTESTDTATTTAVAVTVPSYPASCDTISLPQGYAWPTLKSQLPYDLDSMKAATIIPLSPAPAADCGIFETQKQFDIFSWATFIGLNWPTTTDGSPSSEIIGKAPTSPRVWENYSYPLQIFKEWGVTPDPWGTNISRILSETSKRHLLDEVDEAFFNRKTPLPPIVDLNQEYVRYEIRINKSEFDYINKHKLYNKEGQREFVAAGKSVSFPTGDSATNQVGAMELKVAWKKLTHKEKKSKKFHTIKATVLRPYETPVLLEGQYYGLVGMHIMVRIKGASEWVWATFEHVDNAPLVDLRNQPHKVNDLGKVYSFWDSAGGKGSLGGFDDNALVAIKKAGKANAAKGLPAGDYYQKKADRQLTQIAQVITDNNSVISSKWTNHLNTKMQTLLKGTVWENYRLISTQWPVDSGQGLAGNPAPVSLGNPVMETYMQINGSCMNCHAGATFNGSKVPNANFSFMLQRAKSSEIITNQDTSKK